MVWFWFALSPLFCLVMDALDIRNKGDTCVCCSHTTLFFSEKMHALGSEEAGKMAEEIGKSN